MAADAATVYVTPAVKLVSSKDGVAAFTVTFVRILLEALLLSPPPRTTTCWNKILFLRCAIPIVRLNYMVRWIQSKDTTIKYG